MASCAGAQLEDATRRARRGRQRRRVPTRLRAIASPGNAIAHPCSHAPHLCSFQGGCCSTPEHPKMKQVYVARDYGTKARREQEEYVQGTLAATGP